MIENILQKLGLSDKEIKVYLTCLRLGPSAVRKIAQEADINRGTTYDILKSLKESGLVSYYHQEKNQYFIAEDPAKLTDALERRQADLAKMKGEIESIIPQLRSMYDDAGTKPIVKLYEGEQGIKTILSDVLTACAQEGVKSYYAFSSSTIKEFLYKAYPHYTEDRIAAGLAVQVISIGPGGEKRGLDERKWLTTTESAPTYTLIYAGKIGMISVDGNGQAVGIMIEDFNMYQTQKIIFESLWHSLPN